MNDSISIVYSGGPMNGMVQMLYEDHSEIHIPILFSTLDWSERTDPLDVKYAVYRRTGAWDDNLNKIFEFCGVV